MSQRTAAVWLVHEYESVCVTEDGLCVTEDGGSVFVSVSLSLYFFFFPCPSLPVCLVSACVCVSQRTAAVL